MVFGCETHNTMTFTPTASQIQLTPYLTATKGTAFIKSNNLPTKTQLISPIPSPTPTPYLYIIVEGDTFTSIAFRQGISTNELIESNPDIDPNFLTIGSTITIPIPNSALSLQHNPTPLPITIEPPVCYPDKLGGSWCLALVHNSLPYDVENISAEITATYPQQDKHNSQVIFSSLYVLPSGQSIPLIAHYPPPSPNDLQPQIKILSVIPKSNETGRYLTPKVEDLTIKISDSYLSALIIGEVSILENQDAARVWVVAVAYSQDDSPVGIRKWESSSSLPVGEIKSFKFHVYSLGPIIDHVELHIEAHP